MIIAVLRITAAGGLLFRQGYEVLLLKVHIHLVPPMNNELGIRTPVPRADEDVVERDGLFEATRDPNFKFKNRSTPESSGQRPRGWPSLLSVKLLPKAELRPAGLGNS